MQAVTQRIPSRPARVAAYACVALMAAVASFATAASAEGPPGPAITLPEALAERLGAVPAGCPAALEWYGRAESAQCFTVNLKGKRLQKTVNRFLDQRFSTRYFFYGRSSWVRQDAYLVRSIFHGEGGDILFDSKNRLLIVLRRKSCFSDSSLVGVATPDEFEGERWTLPKLATSVRPDYPERARAAHVNGGLVLEAIIGRTGRVEEVCLAAVHPQGFGLGDAGSAAVRQWTYEPATHDGKPVPVLISIFVAWETQPF